MVVTIGREAAALSAVAVIAVMIPLAILTAAVVGLVTFSKISL